MTKLLALALLIAIAIGTYWTVRVGGADGSWIAIVAPFIMLALLLGITKRRTGEWLSDSAGGH